MQLCDTEQPPVNRARPRKPSLNLKVTLPRTATRQSWHTTSKVTKYETTTSN